jgi:hypothetical protein
MTLTSHQLVSETALDKGETELILTTEQAEKADPTLLRRFAAASESEEVNGRSVKLEMVQFFTCQYTLSDFVE